MTNIKFQSNVETQFQIQSGRASLTTRIPYLVVDNFPQLGLLTALRFLEWSADNPEGVVSLPTGKTPEYFIKWVQHLLANWAGAASLKFRAKYGLELVKKPKLCGLKFVQIDEFFPIDPSQHNSFNNYVRHYYLKGFGLETDRALLINCDDIPRPGQKHYSEIFPLNQVDLSLRYREAQNSQESLQREAIFMVDQWCSEYEERIRGLGGIGFFLGGIGPDGHIAFNVKGSDIHSVTRLTHTNFETQAAAATDLGGIEISRNRLVITIGLSTITSNKDATAIIIAAGEAKANVVKNALENLESNLYPATVLGRLTGSRFYLTRGASRNLTDSQLQALQRQPWSQEKKERIFYQICQSIHKFGTRITVDDLRNDTAGARIPGISEEAVKEILSGFRAKIHKGIADLDNQVFLHTGPHHDDILLGYLPYIIHLVRSPNNVNVFANMTSGFTSVTNAYVFEVLQKTREFILAGQIEMLEYEDFFEAGYAIKWDKDVYHFLDRIADKNAEGRKRGLSHRIVRALVEIYRCRNKSDLIDTIDQICSYIRQCYDGEKNISDVQRLKGMIREFEEELVWAHYGVRVSDIHHLRLGFYTGDIFTENPERDRDVAPILDLLRKTNPTVISLALDPEGSGPDTHYKVLQAIAEAVRMWGAEKDISTLKIWGYRNVWYRFDPAEADIIIPVSLNSMFVLQDIFMNCYLSQKDASFPSYEMDGPFCDLAQSIWVEQHQLMELILGRDFWYTNDHPRIRAAHGVVFLKEMNAAEFLDEARRLEKSMEGQVEVLN